MKSRIQKILFLLIGLTLIVSTVDLMAQSLNDYIKIAIENNPGLKAKDTEYRIALKKVPQVNALPDPQVNISLFKEPMMLPMGNQLGSIAGMQMFPWPGTLKAMEDEAYKASDVKLKGVDVAMNDLVFRIRNTWYPLLELDEQIAVKKQLLKILNSDKELAIVKIAQGMAPLVDAIRADLMIDEVKTEISLLQQKKKPLELTFNRLLNREDSSSVVINEALPDLSEELNIFSNSVESNPLLAVLDLQVEMAKAEETVAEYMRKPMIGAGLQYMVLIKRPNNELIPNTGQDMIMPMATVTVPIWTKKYDAAVAQTRLMQQMYTEMKSDMTNEMTSMAQMVMYDLGEKKQMYMLINAQIKKIEQATELVISSYRNAGSDFEEVLRLQQQCYKYKTEKISLRKEYQILKAKLEYIKGNNYEDKK